MERDSEAATAKYRAAYERFADDMYDGMHFTDAGSARAAQIIAGALAADTRERRMQGD